MRYKKVKDNDRKIAALRSNMERLKVFAMKTGLNNVEIHCSKLLEKLESKGKISQNNLDSLKDDLMTDILGPTYYGYKFPFIPASNTGEYYAAYSVNYLDEYIFGGKQKKEKEKKLSPIDVAPPDDYDELSSKMDYNLIDNLSCIEEEVNRGIITRPLVVMVATTFRSLKYSQMEANKKWIQKMESKVYGKHNADSWSILNHYKFLFVKPDGTTTSDFEAVADSVAHGDYHINEDYSVTIIPGDAGFISKAYTFTFYELVQMLKTEYYIHARYIPALIMVETVINSNNLCEEA